MGQLKKPDYGDEMNDRFDVLPIINRTHAEKQRAQRRDARVAFRFFATVVAVALLITTREVFDAANYAVLAIRVALDSMIASRTQRARATGALHAGRMSCVIRAIHNFCSEPGSFY